MTVLITLTTAGLDSGPFDLYSNLDGYTTAFEIGVSKASLLGGYSSIVVPDSTTIIRVKSEGNCINYIDITLEGITTTTTTTVAPTTTTTTTSAVPIVDCNETLSSGGAGVTEYTVNLEPAGGFIVFEFNAYNFPDKVEIIHNTGKVATTGMTGGNGGPYDNIYGDPVIPTYAQTLATTQFIGLDSGVIPDRQSDFAIETGSSLTIEPGYQQLIWFVYDASDYSNSSTATVRVTGPTGTIWDIKRLCEPVTTTTTTTAAP